ncbi:MAG TPA: GPP34 family phosphoprotein, partial [Candidatus Dormibacteraeota bacterium]
DVAVLDPTTTGDDVLDDALRAIAGSRRPRNARHWVNALPRAVPGHRARLVERLVRRGTLRAERHVTLGVFRSTRHPLGDHGVGDALHERIRRAVLDWVGVDPEIAALIGIAQAAGVVDRHFSDAERDVARRRVKEITAEQVVGGAVSGTVQAVNAAMVAGVTAAVLASSAPTS